MASLSITLPDQMKAWIDEQVAAGRYVNASDYVRDLVRRDQTSVQTAGQRTEIDGDRTNGADDASLDKVFAETKRKSRAALKARNTVSGAR